MSWLDEIVREAAHNKCIEITRNLIMLRLLNADEIASAIELTTDTVLDWAEELGVILPDASFCRQSGSSPSQTRPDKIDAGG